jgi:hypothetical protein
MSWHVHGRAFDIQAPLEDLKKLGLFWKNLGGTWGGSFGDPAHFGWHPGVEAWQLCPEENSCNFQRMEPVYPNLGIPKPSKKVLQAIVAGVATFAAGMYIVRKT